jgi:hypothetical protein
MEQCFARSEVERRGAGRYVGVLVNLRVADAVNSVAAEQVDCSVGELPASLGCVVLPTCGNAPSLEPAAVGCGGFSIETGGDPLHGGLAVDEHR